MFALYARVTPVVPRLIHPFAFALSTHPPTRRHTASVAATTTAIPLHQLYDAQVETFFKQHDVNRLCATLSAAGSSVVIAALGNVAMASDKHVRNALREILARPELLDAKSDYGVLVQVGVE